MKILFWIFCSLATQSGSFAHAMGRAMPDGKAAHASASLLELLDRDLNWELATTKHRDQAVLWTKLDAHTKGTPHEEDLLLLKALVLRSIELWDRLLSCNSNELPRARIAYLRKNLCPLSSDNEALTQDISDFHADMASYLSTATVLDSMPSEVEERFSRPAYLAFRDLWLANGYNVKFPLNPFFVQVVLENLALTPFYPGLDSDFWSHAKEQYRQSKQDHYEEYLKQSDAWFKKGRVILAAREDYIKYMIEIPQPKITQSLEKNAAFDAITPLARKARNALRLLGYVEHQCGNYGFWPRAAAKPIDSFKSIIELEYFLNEFKEQFRRDISWARIIYGSGCTIVDSLERESQDDPLDVIVFYRSLAKLYLPR